MQEEIQVQVQGTQIENAPYSATAMALIAAAEAEVKVMCAMASRFPRDLDVVREKLLRECKRPSFAASALYAKPVGNTKVTGLSVRFAEAAIASMGHIHTTIKTLAETDEYRKIEIRVWDAQNMVSYADEATVEKTIERKSIPKGQEYVRMRVNRSGEPLYVVRATEDDLLNKVNAAKSKSIRNSGLRMVPGWLLDECKSLIVETTRKADASDPDAAKRKLFDSFSELGVQVDDIKKYLGHNAEKLEPSELADLRQLFVAIRDGETTMRAVFKQREEVESSNGNATSGMGTQALKERLKPTPAHPSTVQVISKEQVELFWKKAKELGWKENVVHAMLMAKFELDSVNKIPAAMFQGIMGIIEGGS